MAGAGVNEKAKDQSVKELPSAVVRFAGDSGDGMQLAGTQFTDTSAVLGNDVATLPDFPAEIRAPAGTVAGVSGFQINFASTAIHTPGDVVNALIAMNPAAFKAHIDDVEQGGIVVVNDSEFNKINLRKAGFGEGYNPIEDEKYTQKYKIYRVPITRLNEEALAELELGAKDVGRCKNMFALGLIYWMFDRPLDTTIRYLEDYFGKKKKLPQIAAANVNALKSGFYFGETTEMIPVRYQVPKASIAPGTYRKVTGNEATAMGLISGVEAGQEEPDLLQLPDHPGQRRAPRPGGPAALRGQDVPGRGRDRRRLRGDRRFVRRSAGGDRDVGPWFGAQERGVGAGGDDGAAADRGQCPAGRAVDRAAHQDGTIGPASGALWPKRRLPVGGGGAPVPG